METTPWPDNLKPDLHQRIFTIYFTGGNVKKLQFRILTSWQAMIVVAAVAALASADALAAEVAVRSGGNRPAAARFDGIWNKATPGLRYSSAPPYRPEAQRRFDSLKPQDDPGARCTESGTARIMISPYPLQIIARDDHLLVISEFNHVVRRIWTDATEFPRPQDMEPLWYGNPRVHWDGETMVVETIGYKAGNYIDPAGDLMSDAMRITERWSLKDADTLQIEFTFDDPNIYTRPWSSTQLYKRRPGLKLGEFSCTENNRNNPDDARNPKSLTSTEAPQRYNTTGPEGRQPKTD